jgi:hypothetical protein
MIHKPPNPWVTSQAWPGAPLAHYPDLHHRHDHMPVAER